MPGTEIWTFTAASAGLLIAPSDNVAAATKRRLCKVRCMLVILLRNAGPERPGSRDQDLSALDLAHEPLPGQACRKVYAPNKATESGLSLSHFVSLSIFIGFHQPAYRGVVHAEMLRNRRHRMP